MTETTENRTMRYTGDGSTTSFPYSFTIAADSDLVVVSVAANGVETTLVLGTGYTVTGAGVDGGGTVVLTTAPAVGTSLVIVSDEPATQETQFRNQGPYFNEDAEAALDKRARIDEQQQQEIDRSLKFPVGEAITAGKALLPFDRASKVLGFDAGKQPIAMAMPSGVTVPVESVVQIVDTIADLKDVATPSTAVVYLVRGYYAAGDGGGGLFRWYGADATADNGGTVIAPTSGSGRWNRLYSGRLESRWFGAKHDGSTDDSAAVQAMVSTGLDWRFSIGGSLKLTTGFEMTTRYQQGDMSSAKVTNLGAPIYLHHLDQVLESPHIECANVLAHGVIVVGSATDSAKTSHYWTIRNPKIITTNAKYGIVVANGSYIGSIDRGRISMGNLAGSCGLYLGELAHEMGATKLTVDNADYGCIMRGVDFPFFNNCDFEACAVNPWLIDAIPAAATATPFGTGSYPNGEGSWWGSPTQVVYNLNLRGCYTELTDICIYAKTGLELKGLGATGCEFGINNLDPDAKVGTRVFKTDIPVSAANFTDNWCGIPDYVFDLNNNAIAGFVSLNNKWSDVGHGTGHTDLATGGGADRIYSAEFTAASGGVISCPRGVQDGATAAEKRAWFGATPIVQPSGATQAALTNSTGGTADGTLAAVGATNTGDRSGTINDNFTELHTLVNAIRTALVNLGHMKGSA